MSTPNGAVIDRSADQWRAPVDCPECKDESRRASLTDPSDTEPRESEAAILEQAFIDGNASLEQSWREISPIIGRMVRAYYAASDLLANYRLFVHKGTVGTAHRALDKVVRRHDDDGPEDRRHRPKWLHPAVVWTVFAASATYDTFFISGILQRMLDASPGDVNYYVSFFPGIGIMVGLAVTATMFAKASFRQRSRRERRLQRWTLLGRQTREPDDLPWPLWTPALLFGGFVLGTLGIWALIRARLATLPPNQWNLEGLHTPGVLLLILLTVAAIGLRVLAYNPYADRDAQARTEMGMAEAEAHAIRRQATQALAHHATTWAEAQGAVATARSRAERFVAAGRAQIMEIRAERSGGQQPPVDNLTPMTLGLWPANSEDRGPATVDLAGALRLHCEILDPAARQVERLHPERLEADLAEIDAELSRQLATPTPDPSPATHDDPRTAMANDQGARAGTTDANSVDPHVPETPPTSGQGSGTPSGESDDGR